jgi:hypothetical protein
MPETGTAHPSGEEQPPSPPRPQWRGLFVEPDLPPPPPPDDEGE